MPPAHACDACKRRKVKCNGIEPCANCRISHLRCSYGAIPTKSTRKVPNPRNEVPSPDTDADDVSNARCVSQLQADSEVVIANPLQHSPSDAQQSPQSLLTAYSGISPNFGTGGSTIDVRFRYGPERIYLGLVTSARAILTSKSITNVVHESIDFFFQYIFPNTPVAHEPTLRATASLLDSESLPNFSDLSRASDIPQHISYMRRFALITALCAFVTSVSPGSSEGHNALLSKVFLSASWAMLRYYEEFDLDHPDSTSLTIRMWHSAAMQNTTGRVGSSYHYHAEAAFLAQRLRLYNEQSLQQYSATESRLLRLNFWLLYLADKTSIAFETRLPCLNETYFGSDFTLLEEGLGEDPLLDTAKRVNQVSLETRLLTGFHLKRRIWSAAVDFLGEIKLYSRQKTQVTIHGAEEASEITRLAESHLLFSSLADQLPVWLRNPEAGIPCDDEEVVNYQKTCFWVQRSNIMTVFHCMRLLILQKSLEHGLPGVVGLGKDPMSWGMRKIDIIRDFLHELQVVPFPCFKFQGETAVERLRRVGTILLELVHNAENKTIEAIARSQFERLLDLLAKLDSKASDELAGAPLENADETC